MELLSDNQAVCPYIEQKDELSEVSNSGRKIKLDNHDIDIQTPQGFRFGLIKKMHIQKQDEVVSDDISLIEQSQVKFFEGDKNNFKVTTDIDLKYLKSILEPYAKDN